MARKVPDDVYVVMPNQLGIDTFDLEDALGEQKEYMCSQDLKEFIEKYHLDLSIDSVLNQEMPSEAMTIPTMYTIRREPGTWNGI